jgi:hypothetical protein
MAAITKMFKYVEGPEGDFHVIQVDSRTKQMIRRVFHGYPWNS